MFLFPHLFQRRQRSSSSFRKSPTVNENPTRETHQTYGNPQGEIVPIIKHYKMNI